MIGVHIKTALSSIRRAPFQALAAISVLVITFWVATILSVLVYSSNQLLNYFTTRPQIIAFLKAEATLEETQALQDRLKGDLRIREVNYVSKEQALEIYKEATSDNPLLAELVDPSIFPASLEFTVNDLEFANKIIEEVKSEEVVEQVGFTASLGKEESLTNVVNRLKTVSLYLKAGGLIVALVLGFTSFLVLTVVIGMRIATRRNEIETLSLIGAKRGFIVTPIIFESILYAVIGVLIGWILALIFVLYTTPTIIKYFGEIPVLPKDSIAFFGLLMIIFLSEFLIGVLIALAGGFIAVARAKRRK